MKKVKKIFNYWYTKYDKEMLQKTIKMWEWLAKTGSDNKHQYFFENPSESLPNGKIPVPACFLCDNFRQVCKEIKLERSDECSFCPCSLGNNDSGCASMSYDDWSYTTGLENRKKYAKKFAEELKKLVSKRMIKIEC